MPFQPVVCAWSSDDYDISALRTLMQFRLVYEGRLPAESRNDTRSDDKHRIRKAFHPQLKLLWDQHPGFAQFRDPQMVWDVLGQGPGDLPPIPEQLGTNFARCGHRFVPIVGEWSSTVCGLDILFLRRESPGQLVRHGGDLDNRIKTLFDALRIPDACGGISEPEVDEDPLFCLLQDDKLITNLTITTDKLLKPLAGEQNPTDVMLIINVTIRQTKLIGFSPFPLA